jgi:hypothetical protein
VVGQALRAVANAVGNALRDVRDALERTLDVIAQVGAEVMPAVAAGLPVECLLGGGRRGQARQDGQRKQDAKRHRPGLP